MGNNSGMRSERDSMGVLDVPANAYYGGNTRRAVLNFPISDLRFGRSFIRAIGQIKLCAAEVNRDLGRLNPMLPRPLSPRRNVLLTVSLMIRS